MCIATCHCERSAAIRFCVRVATAALLLAIVSTATAKYSGGTGEPNDPYQIATAADLIALGEDPNDYDKHFILTADIDLDPNLPGRKVFDKAVIAPDINDMNSGFDGTSFDGVIDGNGHTISNFRCASEGRDYAGVLGYTAGYPGEIRNLRLVNAQVNAVDGNNVGALVGDGGQILNCCVEGGSVSGKDRVGGLAGSSGGGQVSNCHVMAAISGRKQVGGLMGCAAWSGVSNSYVAGSVRGNEEVGGLLGQASQSPFWAITDSYSLATVSGDTKIGGLSGSNYGRMINCYSAGRVVGKVNTGGLTGYNEGEITACFWDTETSGCATSAGGIGKTTTEMQDVSTFAGAGWDFQGETDGPSDIWVLVEGGGYPLLWWQVPQSQLAPLPAFSGGTGQSEDPYIVSTVADLNHIGHNPRLMAAHFILTNDVNLAGLDFHIIGSEGIPFEGIFDGNFKRVLNLRYQSTARGCIGFFGRIKGAGTVVNDLRLVDPNIDAGTGDLVASLVGDNWIATIMDCSVEGGCVRSSGTYVGGLAGYSDGSISGSYATCSVSGQNDVGGLVGHQSFGNITASHSTGAVRGSSSVGGLVGTNWGSIATSYSTGSVSGSGDDVGGLVGVNHSGSIVSSFWDTDTSGQTTSAGGTGKTTAEMQTASTFIEAGWDFVGETANGTEDIWWIDEGKDYPRLWWEQGDEVSP